MPWYENDGPEGDVVLCTCADLLRNPEGMAFPGGAEPGAARALWGRIADRLSQNGFDEVDPGQCDEAARQVLREQLYLPPIRPGERTPTRLLLNEPCHIALLLGGEDHVRIRGLAAGLSLKQVYEGVWRAAEVLECVMEPAFSPTFGYLTRDPARVGTGLDITITLFLPALAQSGQLAALMPRLAELGLALTDFPLPGSALGGLVRLACTHPSGIPEKNLLTRMEATAAQLIRLERQADAPGACGAEADELREACLRARAILAGARTLGAEELPGLVGYLLRGIRAGVFDDCPPASAPAPASLLIGTQPGLIAQKDPAAGENPDRARAAKVRLTLERLSDRVS